MKELKFFNSTSLHYCDIVVYLIVRTTHICLLAIVNGNWGAWGAWSTCSATCGIAVWTRYRSCNSPPPANGGSYCQGNNDETTSCLTKNLRPYHRMESIRKVISSLDSYFS